MKKRISEILNEFRYFWQTKCFAAGIILTTLISYGIILTNPTIGVDDTAFAEYYADGISPAMGRWCVYLLNKIFPMAYNPFVCGAIDLIVFGISITLWCVVFRRMFGEKISVWGYTLFGCVMLSSPIISELVVWYVHNGITMGYGLIALAVLFTLEALREGVTNKIAIPILPALFLLTVALGFYESFMIVYLMAVLMVFLLIRLLDKKEYSKKAGKWLVLVLIITVGSIILRSMITQAVIMIFGLRDQVGILNSRGILEFLGWFDKSKGLQDFIYVMQDFFVKYYLNAAVYLPITLLVMAIGVLMVYSMFQSVKKKDYWILAAALGIIILPWCMPVLEGVATYYRTSQYIPLMIAFVVLLIVWEFKKHKVTGFIKGFGIFLAVVLLYNQVYEMGKWLYLDMLKYNDAKRTMEAVALTLKSDFDASKPICVIGSYRVPESLETQAYSPVWSKKTVIVTYFVGLLNEELLDKYYDAQKGYAFAETPRLSVIEWGASAFYGFDRQLIKFWKMIGFTFTEDGSLEHYREARELMEDGPVWPEPGSIVEQDDYIIVNFG